MRGALGPFRRFRFHMFDQLGNGHGARQPADDVNVIDPTAHSQRNTARLFDVMAEHSKHFVTEVVSLEVGAAILGAEDEVQSDAGE